MDDRGFSKGWPTGMKTTCYPAGAERAPGISPGRPVGGEYPADEIPLLLARCPVGAIRQSGPSRRKGRLSPLHSLLSLHARPGNTVGLGTRIRVGGRLWPRIPSPYWAMRFQRSVTSWWWTRETAGPA